MLKPGRPKKTAPQLIFGLLSLPYSGGEIVAEYLELRYNFTRVSLRDLLQDYRIDNNLQDFSDLDILEKYGHNLFLKKALGKIEKAGRPLALIENEYCFGDFSLCAKLKDFHTIFLNTNEKIRLRNFYLQNNLSNAHWEEFRQKEEVMLQIKNSDNQSLHDFFNSTDYKIVHNGSLPLLYNNIEKILIKTCENNLELPEILKKRKRL